MPPINPYEAPQSDAPGTVSIPQSEDNDDPAWVVAALYAQLGFILVLGLLLNLDISLFTGMLGLCIISFFFSLGVGLLATAICYRIVWLMIIELIVIGLPLKMLFT